MTQQPPSIASQFRTLGELFGLTDQRVASVSVPINPVPGPLTPAVKPQYRFTEDQVRRLMLWTGGAARRNLMIHGPTGSGKSSVIEQFSARIGRECYRVACHGRMEFTELTGQLTVLSDGSTKFLHGPLPRAMLGGCNLILDEANFLHPSIMGALNTVLDGGPLLIPETSELIVPHPNFRIAATGNGIDQGDDAALYRGTQRMNLAFKMRFLMMHVDYLEKVDEVIMLHNYFPTLPGNLLEKMVDVANEVREAFKRGDIETPISTRTLEDWGSVLQARQQMLAGAAEDEIKFALAFVLTDGAPANDARVIQGVLERHIAGIKIGQSAAFTSPGPGTSSQMSGRTTFNLLINPDRDGKGSMTYWCSALTDGQANGLSGFGKVYPAPVINPLKEQTKMWMNDKMSEKLNASGNKRYSCQATITFDGKVTIADLLADALQSVGQAVRIQKGELQGARQVTVGSKAAQEVVKTLLQQMQYIGFNVIM